MNDTIKGFKLPKYEELNEEARNEIDKHIKKYANAKLNEKQIKARRVALIAIGTMLAMGFVILNQNKKSLSKAFY